MSKSDEGNGTRPLLTLMGYLLFAPAATTIRVAKVAAIGAAVVGAVVVVGGAVRGVQGVQRMRRRWRGEGERS
jgi:hypothetical protein